MVSPGRCVTVTHWNSGYPRLYKPQSYPCRLFLYSKHSMVLSAFQTKQSGLLPFAHLAMKPLPEGTQVFEGHVAAAKEQHNLVARLEVLAVLLGSEEAAGRRRLHQVFRPPITSGSPFTKTPWSLWPLPYMTESSAEPSRQMAYRGTAHGWR